MDYEMKLKDLSEELLIILKIKKKVVDAFDNSNKEEEDMHAHLQMILDSWMVKAIEECSC